MFTDFSGIALHLQRGAKKSKHSLLCGTVQGDSIWTWKGRMIFDM